MADHTISVSNSLRLFGEGPSSLWNAYNWNAFLWGEGTADMIHAVVVLRDNTLTLDSQNASLSPTHLISETLSVSGETTSEGLQDGSGYNYVFPSNTTEHENQATTSYTSGTAQSTSWSSSTAGSTVWS